MRVLFVCHGNICRSTMAEFIMRKMVADAGMSDSIEVESAGTSDEELGSPVYPGTKRILDAMGIDCSKKRARQATRDDYEKFDLIVGMDRINLLNTRRICKGDPRNKIKRLLDFTDSPRDIADPWYHGDFDATKELVVEGCRALLDYLRDANAQSPRDAT